VNNLPEVGRLMHVELRDVWPHEAHSFTPWVLENADRLSEALGMDLEIEAAEHSVGNFQLDLIGTDLDSGQRVIIENQLESTDHKHLGQILTYAGGTDPKIIIWIAKKFNDEHAAALQWLNENTDDEINFYGVQVSAVKIGDSLPAALFDLIVRPNNWEKRIRSSVSTRGDSSGTQDRYVRFWHQFYERISDVHPEWKSLMRKSDNKSSWSTFATGIPGIWYGVNFAGTWGERTLFRNIKALRSEIYFGSSNTELNEQRFQQFEANRARLELALGFELEFEELSRRKSSRIATYTPGTISDEENWNDYIEFFISSQMNLRTGIEAVGGFSSILEDLD